MGHGEWWSPLVLKPGVVLRKKEVQDHCIISWTEMSKEIFFLVELPEIKWEKS
jgi:hypothetical protein